MPRILLVDDNPDECLLLHQLLEAGGFNVVDAPGDAEACQKFREGGVDVALVEARLQLDSGFAVTQNLRAMDPLAVVVLMALDPRPDELASALRLRAFDLLAKPFTADALFRTVNAAVTFHRRQAMPGGDPSAAAQLAMENEQMRARLIKLENDIAQGKGSTSAWVTVAPMVSGYTAGAIAAAAAGPAADPSALAGERKQLEDARKAFEQEQASLAAEKAQFDEKMAELTAREEFLMQSEEQVLTRSHSLSEREASLLTIEDRIAKGIGINVDDLRASMSAGGGGRTGGNAADYDDDDAGTGSSRPPVKGGGTAGAEARLRLQQAVMDAKNAYLNGLTSLLISEE